MLLVKSKLELKTDYAFISVSPNHAAIVDLDDYDRIKKFHWFLLRRRGVKYAIRSVGSGKKRYYVKI